MNGEFAAAIEDVLDLHTELYGSQRPMTRGPSRSVQVYIQPNVHPISRLTCSGRQDIGCDTRLSEIKHYKEDFSFPIARNRCHR